MNLWTRTVLLAYIALLAGESTTHGQSDRSPYILGEYRVIHSEVLGEDRSVLIHLPESYDSSQGLYPVLYALDGDWTYVTAVAYVNALSAGDRIPEMVVVAVLNVDRRRDFLPTHVDQVPTSGGSDDFIAFVSLELIPFVEGHYRAKPERILYGESNAGLYAVYHLLRKAESFDAYIASSPTVRHDDFAVVGLADSVIAQKQFSETRLFISYGSDEGDWLISPIEKLEAVLSSRAPEGLAWRVEVLEGENHAPPTALYVGLKSVFRKQDE